MIAGKYRIEAKLGEGGMGVVYRAEHIQLGQRVAIKMLLPSMAVQPEFVARFAREARAAATIDSRNVAKVIDVDMSDAGLPYMVIELLEGHDLSAELERGPLSIAAASTHVATACIAIACAHANGIVHRDLKPSNLFLSHKDGATVLKVLDFGIAKVLADGNAKLTSSAFGFGTPHYMSPEQIRRAADVDARTDVWSLGMILYELLTGVVPLPDDAAAAIAAIVADPIRRPRTLRPDIPKALEAVIMRALEKDRALRFQSASELAAALAPFVDDAFSSVISISAPISLRDAQTRRVSDSTVPAMARTPSIHEKSSLSKRVVGVVSTFVVLASLGFVAMAVHRAPSTLDSPRTNAAGPATAAMVNAIPKPAEPVIEPETVVEIASAPPVRHETPPPARPVTTARTTHTKSPSTPGPAASDYPLTL